MSIKALAAVLFISMSMVELNQGDLISPHDSNMFSYCSQRRNITLVVNLNRFEASFFAKFFFLIKELIEQEDCYMVNIYLPREDRAIRLTRNTSINRMYRSSMPELLREPFQIRKFQNFANKLYDEPILGNEFVTQTFVLMTYHIDQPEFLKSLTRLQNERNWDVIIYWESELGRVADYSIEIPLHRLVCKNYKAYNDFALKNLIDVIKEPTFSRYDFYRSLTFEDNFFNETCLNGVKKIHITVYVLNDLYLPMALAIVGKENERRRKKNIEPLKVIFYMYQRFRKPLQDLLMTYDENVKLDRWHQHPLYKEKAKSSNKDSIYVSIIEDYGSYCDNFDTKHIPRQDFFYRYQYHPIPVCLKDKRWKTFQTPDEFYQQLNKDVCKV